MSEKMQLILIIEDDRDLAQLNARLLKRQGYDAVVAYTAAEARNIVRKKTPDLFVFDVVLPDGDGFALCKEFRQYLDTPVLFLTGKSETIDRITGLNAGGDYYLTKPYDRNEFLAVVNSLLRREGQNRQRIESASVIVRGSMRLNLSEYKVYVNGRDAELTPKEFAIFKMLVQNEGKELSAQTIYENIWETTMNNDANAIRLHISRLKKKIEPDNKGDINNYAILTSYGGGYTFIKI